MGNECMERYVLIDGRTADYVQRGHMTVLAALGLAATLRFLAGSEGAGALFNTPPELLLPDSDLEKLEITRPVG